MNSSERVHCRLNGEAVDRPPNFDILMAYAAHFIGQPLSRYYLDYHVLAAANRAVQAEFDLDLLQAISDPYREACDFGLEVEFPPDGLPLRRRPLLREPGDLNHLQPPDPHNSPRCCDRLEAVRAMRQDAGDSMPVMGWVEGALAEANVLRGDTALMLDLYDRPEWVLDLLEVCVEVEIAFACAQLQAGATMIGLGDAIASQISPHMYARFALPYERRIFEAVHQQGGLARLHICGDTTGLLDLMPQTGADIIDVDWMVDMRQAARTFGDRAGVCGNFDPVAVMLNGSLEQVYSATRACLENGGRRAFSAAGCEVPDGTPPANLFAQRQALTDFFGGGG